MKLHCMMALLLSLLLLFVGCGEQIPEDGYYLVIRQEGILDVEVTTPQESGGCRRADNEPFEKGDKVWLEQLEGVTDLRGVTLNALDITGETVYALEIPEDATNEELVAILEKDSWLVMP